MTETLKGVAFAHPRIIQPLRAAAELFASRQPEVTIEWAEHSLQEFEELSLCTISERFDLFAFDHPLLGDVIPHGCVLDLEQARPGLIHRLAPKSLGLSLQSYIVEGALYGVPFDGAVQSSARVRSYFQNVSVPGTLDELAALVADQGREAVALPLLPAHAGCTFLTLAANVSPLSSGDERFYLNPQRIGRAFDVLSDLRSLSSPSSITLDPIRLLEDMASGNGPLFSPFVFGYGTYASSGFSDEPLTFGPALSVGAGITRAVLGGAGIGISAAASGNEALLDFVEFLMSDEVMSEVVGAHHGQAGLRAGWGPGADRDLREFFFAPTQEAMDAGIVRPRFAGFVNFLCELGDQLIGLIDREASVADAIDTVNRLFNSHCQVDSELDAIISTFQPPNSVTTAASAVEHTLPANSPLDGKTEAAGQH